MTNQQEAPLRDADATNRGAMTPAHVVALTSAQTDATQAKAWSDPATSKTIGNAGTTQTFAEVVLGVIRAVAAAALVFKSSLGSSASDVCFKRGTTVSAGDANGSAQLDWLGLGLDGVETPRRIVFTDGKVRSYYAANVNNAVLHEWYAGGARSAYLAISPAYPTTATLYLGNGGGLGDNTNQRLFFDPLNGSVVIVGRYSVSSSSIAVISQSDRAQPDDATLHLFKNGVVNKSRVLGNGDYEHLVAGGGIVLRSPNGNRWRITVDNSGALGVVAA